MNERGLTTVLKGIYAFVMKRIDALSKRIESITASKIGAMQEKDPAGTGTFSMNRKASSAKGDYSSTLGKDCTASERYAHAEGYLTVASEEYSHAEGAKTVARGGGSHAEGISSGAWGNGSHAEGSSTTASGSYSHAEGERTTASGVSAHAEGHITTASSSNQHVQGRCNIEDAEGKYAHIVGNGTMDKRSNAHTLDWSGNSWYAGKVTAQGYEVEAGGTSHALAASDVGAISDTDGSVQNAHLADSAVTTDKLAEAERMTSANIVGALGYAPEEKSGEWELIGVFNSGEEDVKNWEITKDPDGNAIKCSKLYYVIQGASTITDKGCSIFTRYSKGSATGGIYVFSSRALTAKYPCNVLTEVINKHLALMQVLTFSTSGSPEDVKSATAYSADEDIYLTGFSLYSGSNILANTTVTVYGIRA